MSDPDIVEILLVEDNPEDAEIALRALRKNHLANNIMHVSDGREALDFLESRGAGSGAGAKTSPRLILLDLKLPRIDGLEVLRRLKGDAATRMIPVVILTSSTEETDLVKSYQLGANSYLVKPVDFDKFSESMREVGMYWLLLNKSPEG